MPSHMNVETQPERPRSKLVWIIPLAILGVLVAAYLIGALVFSTRFLPGTTLDGQDVSLMTLDAVAAQKADDLAGFQAHVAGDGVDLSLTGAEVGLAYDGDAYARDAMRQVPAWAWPYELTRTRSISAEAPVVYDRDAIVALVQPFVDAASQQEAETAGSSVAYDPASGSFTYDASIIAQFLDAEAAADAIGASLETLEPEIVLGPEQLVSGGDALDAAVAAANVYLGAAPTQLTVNGQAVLELGRDTIASWVTVGDDLSVSLNQEALSQWVAENVGALDTAGHERTYTRADGKQVSVSGGSYGLVTNEDETATALAGALAAGAPSTLEIPLKQSPQTAPDAGGRDWGNRYVDIDLSEQHVRMYDDAGALVWESDCVTGDASKGYDTPTGVYTMNRNRASGNVELRGKIDPATNEPEYISYVEYWMPFIDNSYALHDASWRGSFGGTIYQWNGSHGCVNLPTGKAAELYGLCQVGDVVVVHY